ENSIFDSDIPYMLEKDEKGYLCTSYTRVAEDDDTITMVSTEIDMYQADDAAISFLFQFLGLLMGLTLIVFFFIDRRMKKYVVKPILDMNQAARNYIADKDDGLPDEYHFQALNITTNDEIESLSRIFAEMEKEIGQYVENMTKATAERERINSELNVAAQIQRGTLPSVFPPYPDKPEFDIYASVEPAKEVGGDFYDFFLIDDDHLAMVVADVSGKGIPAALFMMACKILISNLASVGITDPGTILSMVNNRIIEDNPLDMFITVWLGILDIKTGKLIAANGGHEYPCLRTGGKNYEILKDRHGLVLGGMSDAQYYTYEIQLNPGDALFVYSDGVPESTSSEKELFGLDRMLDSLNRNINLPLDQLLSGLKKDIDDFVGEAPQFDDITMLALRYNGGGNMNELTVEAIIDNVPAVTRFVDEKLEALDCPLRAQTQIDVAIDELFSNIAKYAYHPDTGPATVRVEVEKDPMAVIITFIDNGIPYDPLSAEVPDVTLNAEQRQIGGLGIYLVRKTMDEITYEYKDGQNILRIKKEI
ncbi:MAG: SpoIIE family protein phosphatase, partial [Erysipelotrichaceae bacterium]|nr:SpoIIE family protein phosphatase [Erysipelotrichaceae bacterium]